MWEVWRVKVKSNLFILNFYHAQKVWNLLTYSLGTEQEILTSASLKSASMQERKQLFPLISTTIPTFPETLNCLFNRSLSSQNKHGNNYSCVFTSAVKHHIRVASVPQKPSWCFQWKFKNPLLSTRICLHLSAVALDTNVAWLQNKLLLFKRIHFSWPEIQQIMTIQFLMWLSIQFCWLWVISLYNLVQCNHQTFSPSLLSQTLLWLSAQFSPIPAATQLWAVPFTSQNGKREFHAISHT